MSSKSTEGKGREKKQSGELSKSSGSSSEGASKPTIAEMEVAVSTLGWALETIGVTKSGIIGGEAVSIYAAECGLRPRQTKDIDLIIQPTTLSADLVSTSLTTNETVKDYFVSKRVDYVDKPHVVVIRGSGTIHIPIEIFDWQVWPERQQYYNLDWEGNEPQYCRVNNRQTPLLGPGWLIRQKILAYAQRQNRNMADMEDIHSLRTVLDYKGVSISITDDAEVAALKTVLGAPNPPDLKGYVLCEAVWPTQWTWDAKHTSYFRYDESWEKVWSTRSE